MSSRQPKKFTPTQPRTYKVSMKAVLSLPARLCQPPPAVGKVRSCTVTPLYNVRLDDVLDRNHLPPLGLKDFEEWLLFVEMSPENLYFILWLRDYKQRYNQWKSQSAFQKRNATSDYNWSTQHSSQLAMFYARAKQTFFTPGSEYELNLTSTLLAPFHKPDASPHPDPSLFREVKLETYRTLDASLKRFVHAQFNNVGNSRIMCGIVAGIIFTLVGFIPPLALNFLHGGSRWARLLALPGLWVGITVLLTSLNGVCMGIYIFGDLRQLRKFELSRPPISKPQPLPPFKGHHPVPRPVSPTDSILPIQQPRKQGAPNSGSSRDRTPSIASEASSHTISSDDHIQISPAYYDADDIDVLATSSIYHTDPEKQDNEDKTSANPQDSFLATAGFIRPFDPMSDDEEDLQRSMDLPQRHQLITPFDFDSLPSRPKFMASSDEKSIHNTPAPTGKQHNLLPIQIPRPPEPAVPTGTLARMQDKCNIAPYRLQTGYLEPDTPSTTSWGPGSPQAPHPSSPYWSEHPNHSSSSATATARSDPEKTMRKRLKNILSVPAFAVPLARVLNPVIVRGQWEIVIRCMILAFLLAWTIVGGLLAIPPLTRK
ncbi:hypothetical protein GALMADRAFT_220768 [Galerina marginata CBS 339.88]|uniref:RGS domain-containing protein n=1 Tax=Galerina marginata (strain CBS 339.88) TaxID=685588 RepID=A0A067TKB3_GALM3|nr:hypothetical protein GALMADRAFT_220768 [Galerina marginata CBS 339.88]